MLALTSVTGKLGSAVLSAIQSHNLVPTSNLVLCTSSDPTSPRFSSLKASGAQLRTFNFTSPNPETFIGCTKLFLVSTPDISLDCHGSPPPGRESVHIAAIDAALKAGVKHVYYTSLAFGSESKAGVMRAHLRTEEYLHGLEKEGKCKITILREGLYNESWPLYLGYFEPGKDERDEIVLAGDGKVSWTSIADMGLGTACMLADKSSKWEGKTIYLSNGKEMARDMKRVAQLVGERKGRELGVKVVGREEFVEYYVKRGKEREAVEWWVSSYKAMEDGECEIEDGSLGELLEQMGVRPKPIEETIAEMLA